MNEILKLNIGIAGCGTMGLPMLEVLLKNKFISSKTEFFDKSDIILSAVRDIDQTLELCEGHNGLFKLISTTLDIFFTRSPIFKE